MSTRRQFLGAGVQLAAAAGMGALAPAAVRERVPTAIQSIATLAPGMTLLSGAGCNVLALKGPEGSLLVDGGYARELEGAARRPWRAPPAIAGSPR